MPFANQHSARLQDPDRYIRFRRGNDEFGDGVDAIWGVTEDESVELQAIRFDADRFTPAEARAWLEDHDHDPILFEEATGEVETVLQFTSNLADTAQVRRENIDGVAYLVAPVVAVREGVMNDEFVSAEEIEHLFPTWNGRPFVLGHPEDADGESTTANDPLTLARIGVGQLFGVTFDDGVLRGDVWIDVKQARDMGADALELVRRLEKGQPVEISTAYFRDREEVAGEWGGVAYEAVARNLKPDHLAALLDDVGACSWDDGCGVPRVNRDDSSSVAVVLRVSEDLAQKLVVEGGLSGDELHLTLAFLGKTSEFEPNQKGVLLRWLGDWAARHAAVTGDVNGVGRFDNQQDEQPYFAILNAPNLPGLRQDLVDSLESDTDVSRNEDHGFVPHVTLAYLKPDQPNPHDSLRVENVEFASVGLWWADERIYFEFGNEEALMETNVLSEARRPTFDGTEDVSWADVDKSFEAYRNGYYEHTAAERPEDVPSQVADAPQAMRDWIAARSLLGDPEAETFGNLLFFPVVNPGTNRLNAGAVRAVLGGRAAQADIPEAALESAQAVARDLLESEFEAEDENTKNANVLRKALRTISEALGLVGNDGDTNDVPAKNEESLEELPRRVRAAWENQNVDDEGMLIGPWIKEVLTDRIIVEAEVGLLSYPFTDEDGDIQFGQPTRVEVVYQEIEEVQDNMDELIKQIVEDGRLNASEEDLSNVPENLLQAIVALLEGFAKPEDQEEEVPPEVNEPEPAAEAETPPVAEPQADPATDPAVEAILERMDKIDSRLEELTANATAGERERKARLVNLLVANNDCSLSKAQLDALDVDTLETLWSDHAPADYSGQGGGPVTVGGNGRPRTVRLAPKAQEVTNG